MGQPDPRGVRGRSSAPPGPNEVSEMTRAVSRPPVGPGEPAPDFTLPAAHGPGSVSLSDYLGKNPVLLALFRGLY